MEDVRRNLPGLFSFVCCFLSRLYFHADKSSMDFSVLNQEPDYSSGKMQVQISILRHRLTARRKSPSFISSLSPVSSIFAIQVLQRMRYDAGVCVGIPQYHFLKGRTKHLYCCIRFVSPSKIHLSDASPSSYLCVTVLSVTFQMQSSSLIPSGHGWAFKLNWAWPVHSPSRP